MIPDQFLQELKYRSDIEQIIGSYVNRRRRGRTLSGLCPFHSEKSPSFTVYPENQSFYCFGCGAGGDVISFIRRIENLDYMESIRFLAQRAGMQVPEEAGDDRSARLRKRILELNRDAARYFHRNLMSEAGRPGRAYLIGRGLTKATITHFGIGYASEGWNGLTDAMKKLGYTKEELLAAHLANEGQRGGCYDIFRNRAIFPIIDLRGNVIAFGGRNLGEKGPKYLNSSDTPVFKKSRNLFALNFAKGSDRKELILCEGYMDVVSMHQAGFTNAVATLGTALTEEQSRLIAQYTGEVVLSYDSDAPGQAATRRATGLLEAAGVKIRVLSIPDAKDPDEFIQHEGCEAFEKRLEEAENSVLYEIRMKERDFDLADPQGKSDFLHEAVRRLVAIEDEIERNSYLEAVAGKYGIAVEVLRKQVGQMALSGAGRTESVKPRNTASNKKEKEGGVEKAQKLMLTWMTSYPALIGKLEKYITPADFTTPLYHQIAEMIVLQYHEGGVNPAKLLNQFVDSEEQKEVAGLFNARIPLETEEEKRRALHDVICNMKENSIAYQSAHMNVTDMAALQKLMADKKSLERWKAGELPDFAF